MFIAVLTLLEADMASAGVPERHQPGINKTGPSAGAILAETWLAAVESPK